MAVTIDNDGNIHNKIIDFPLIMDYIDLVAFKFQECFFGKVLRPILVSVSSDCGDRCNLFKLIEHFLLVDIPCMNDVINTLHAFYHFSPKKSMSIRYNTYSHLLPPSM